MAPCRAGPSRDPHGALAVSGRRAALRGVPPCREGPNPAGRVVQLSGANERMIPTVNAEQRWSRRRLIEILSDTGAPERAAILARLSEDERRVLLYRFVQ